VRNYPLVALVVVGRKVPEELTLLNLPPRDPPVEQGLLNESRVSVREQKPECQIARNCFARGMDVVSQPVWIVDANPDIRRNADVWGVAAHPIRSPK